jgi:hypothetical protein
MLRMIEIMMSLQLRYTNDCHDSNSDHYHYYENWIMKMITVVS